MFLYKEKYCVKTKWAWNKTKLLRKNILSDRSQKENNNNINLSDFTDSLYCTSSIRVLKHFYFVIGLVSQNLQV